MNLTTDKVKAGLILAGVAFGGFVAWRVYSTGQKAKESILETVGDIKETVGGAISGVANWFERAPETPEQARESLAQIRNDERRAAEAASNAPKTDALTDYLNDGGTPFAYLTEQNAGRATNASQEYSPDPFYFYQDQNLAQTSPNDETETA